MLLILFRYVSAQYQSIHLSTSKLAGGGGRGRLHQGEACGVNPRYEYVILG